MPTEMASRSLKKKRSLKVTVAETETSVESTVVADEPVEVKANRALTIEFLAAISDSERERMVMLSRIINATK